MRSRVVADVSRFAAPALVGVSAFAGAGLAGAPAATAASGACASPTSGVTVVVQFPTGSAVGCAPGAPDSALAALRGAGFSTTGTAGYGDGFLCSINGYPIATMCPRVPKDNSWSEFVAQRGGSWVYASLGVTSQKVAPGSVVGFRYGPTNAAPTVPVPPAFATATSTPTTKATAAPVPRASGTTTKPPAHSSAARTSMPASQPAASHSSTPSTTAPHRSTSASSSPSRSASASRSSVSSTASSTSAVSSTSAPSTPVPVVKALQTVAAHGTPTVVVTYNDGSKASFAPAVAKAADVHVGAPKAMSTAASSSAPMSKYSTDVPSSSGATPHPSISTSGTVPMPQQAAASTGGTSLPGLLAGGAVGVAVIGGGAFAVRRRG